MGKEGPAKVGDIRRWQDGEFEWTEDGKWLCVGGWRRDGTYEKYEGLEDDEETEAENPAHDPNTFL